MGKEKEYPHPVKSFASPQQTVPSHASKWCDHNKVNKRENKRITNKGSSWEHHHVYNNVSIPVGHQSVKMLIF